jgi:hypothetical protein
MAPLELLHRVRAIDIVPDNLVFVQGAFAFHLLSPPGPRPATMEAFIQAAMKRDVRASSTTWSTGRRAAISTDRWRSGSRAHCCSTCAVARYSSATTIVPSGNSTDPAAARLEPAAGNVAAVAAGLRKMTLLDFGVPPQFQSS